MLVGPIRLAASDGPGVFVIRAVRDRGGVTVGYVSSGLGFDPIVEQVSGLADVEGVVGVAVDGVEVVPGEGRGRASFVLGGRVFTVRANGQSRLSWLVPVATGVGAVGLLGLAVLVVRGERTDRRRRERAQQRTEELRALAEELVAALSTRAVLEAVANHGSGVVGARYTNVGRRSTSDRSKLEVIHDRGMDGGLAARFAVQDMEESLPLTDCARTGRVVVIPDLVAYREQYPAVQDEVSRAGIQAVMCVPLGLGTDGSIGVIGFAFDQPLDAGELAELESAALLVSQMTGRAYERAVVRERADYLSEFARMLTAAGTVDDVERAVAQLLPPVLDVHHAALVPTAPAEGPSTHCYPPPSPDGDYLVVGHGPERDWTATDETMAMTVVDLIDGALARARLYDQEHAVLQQFQDTLLTTAPPVEGFDIAVGYRAALTAIDMGGDWYSVIDTDDYVFAVIGDVAGRACQMVCVRGRVVT